MAIVRARNRKVSGMPLKPEELIEHLFCDKAANKSMADSRVAAQLKTENSKLQRCLARELGANDESVNVAKVLAQESEWRGRAQQISLLKV